MLAGHYLGVLGIPLYILGYRALANDVAVAAPRAARVIAVVGTVGGVVGAVVHGITGALTAAAVRTGEVIAPSELGALPEAAFLLPLWLIVGGALAIGSVVLALAVGRGGTRFPRALAACNPLVATVAIAALAAPFRMLAAFVVPAAPNLAHVVVFAVYARATRSAAPRSR